LELTNHTSLQRGRNIYEFTHDRFREAALKLASQVKGGLSNISAELADLLLNEEHDEKTEYRISDYLLRCQPQTLDLSKHVVYIKTLVSSGHRAYDSGAPEVQKLILAFDKGLPSI
jgi:hypothetical protein